MTELSKNTCPRCHGSLYEIYSSHGYQRNGLSAYACKNSNRTYFDGLNFRCYATLEEFGRQIAFIPLESIGMNIYYHPEENACIAFGNMDERKALIEDYNPINKSNDELVHMVHCYMILEETYRRTYGTRKD